MYERVLVPLDLTFESDRALGPARAIARHLGAQLDVVVVGSEGMDPQTDYDDAGRACAGGRVRSRSLRSPRR